MAERVNETQELAGTIAALPAGTTGTHSRMSRVGSTAGRIGLPLVVIFFFLLLWQFVPPWAGLHSYELPTLTDTLTGLNNDWSEIGTALLVTLQDALAGFVIGNLLAILGATAFSYSSNAERAFYPLAIVVQSIPVIVYAPLLAIVFFKLPWFGNNPNGAAVVGVAVLITFFPTLVNMNVGFKSVDPRVLELMRLLNASRTQIFLKLRFPSALPFLFSSLKITSTLAFVGALVGEYMVGGTFNPIGTVLSNAGVQSIFGFETNPFNLQGVGGEMQILYSRVDKPGIFAAVLTVSILTLLFFGLMVVLERVLVPWRTKE
jgi:NitT/TauT family transport system permease protein